MNREEEHRVIRLKAYERAFRAGWRARASAIGDPAKSRSWRGAFHRWLKFIHVLPGDRMTTDPSRVDGHEGDARPTS